MAAFKRNGTNYIKKAATPFNLVTAPLIMLANISPINTTIITLPMTLTSPFLAYLFYLAEKAAVVIPTN